MVTSTFILGLFGMACETNDKNPAVQPIDTYALKITPSIHDTQIETVKTIRWAGKQGDVVQFEDSQGQIQQVTGEGTDGHLSALLFGVKQLNTTEIQIARQNGSEWLFNEPKSIEIGQLQGDLPELQINFDEPINGYLLTPIISDNKDTISIIDPLGNIVWSMGHTSHPDIFLEGTLIQALYSKNEDVILVLSSASLPGKTGYIYKIHLTGESIESIPIDGAHISFTEVALNHYYVLGYIEEPHPNLDDTTIIADIIVEVKDGIPYLFWNSFEVFPYETFGSTEDLDWMHVNYLSYDEANEALLLSINRIDSYVSIDIEDGNTNWVLSGNPALSTLQIPSGMYPQLAKLPHSIQAIGNDSFLLFNRSSPSNCSEIVAFQMSEEVVDLLFHFQSNTTPCLQVNFLGQSLFLAEDLLLVNWSDKGQMNIINTDGDIHWQMNSPLGYVFGFSDFRVSIP
jgi:hypothetical protein